MELLLHTHLNGWPAPRHVKRQYNQWADLTHPVFQTFDAQKRLGASTPQIKSRLIPYLTDTTYDFIHPLCGVAGEIWPA